VECSWESVRERERERERERDFIRGGRGDIVECAWESVMWCLADLRVGVVGLVQ